jgi:acyl-CoA dehydrogenase
VSPVGERPGRGREIEDLIASVVAREGTDARAVGAALAGLGLHGIGIAEQVGGSGGDLAELVAVLGALGLHGLSSPLLENAMAAWVLASAGCPMPETGMTLVLTDTAGSRDGLLLDDAPAVPWPVTEGAVVICPADGPPLLLDLAQPGITLDPWLNLAGEPWARAVLSAPAAVQALPSAPPHAAIAARLGLL